MGQLIISTERVRFARDQYRTRSIFFLHVPGMHVTRISLGRWWWRCWWWLSENPNAVHTSRDVASGIQRHPRGSAGYPRRPLTRCMSSRRNEFPWDTCEVSCNQWRSLEVSGSSLRPKIKNQWVPLETMGPPCDGFPWTDAPV